MLPEMVLTVSVSQCWSKQPVQGRCPAGCYFLCCAQVSAEGPAISAAIRRFFFFFPPHTAVWQHQLRSNKASKKEET